MFQIIGIVLLFAMVFGSYVLAGGKFGVIMHALPHEFMAIGGAGVAAFLISNSLPVIKSSLGGLGKTFAGPKWKKQDYKDLLSLLFQLTKTMKSKGVIALESHIEKPAESTIFQKYPKVLKDHFAVDFICDTLRMMTMNLDDPHQVEDAMEKHLEKHHHEALHPAHALQTMADGLPISLAMTSLMSRPDSGSMPLVRQSTGVSAAIKGAAWWHTLRRCVEGTAKMMASAPSSACTSSVVATTLPGSS